MLHPRPEAAAAGLDFSARLTHHAAQAFSVYPERLCSSGYPASQYSASSHGRKGAGCFPFFLALPGPRATRAPFPQ
jgi:hypothetical protein